MKETRNVNLTVEQLSDLIAIVSDRLDSHSPATNDETYLQVMSIYWRLSDEMERYYAEKGITE